MKKSFASLLLLGFVSLCGCGYHAVNWESGPYGGAGKTVNIPLFANKTFKPNVEGVLANALIDEFAKRKGLKVESNESDLTLSGEVVSYSSTAVAYSGADTVKEYSASIKISATLRRNSNRQVLWKGELSWDQSFPANADIALQQNAEAAAIREICGKLAQQLYVTIANDF